MKRLINNMLFFLVVALTGVFIGSRYYYVFPLHQKITKAIAFIHPTKGNRAQGVVRFQEEKNGVRVTAEIAGLTPGAHGFHIHEFGDCVCDDAVCAGGHFNPTNQPHAGPDTPKRHIGDLGNIMANEEGIGIYDFFDNQLQLNGPYSAIGRSVIVHEKEDDLHSQPTGNAGARVGCGAIGIAKDTPS